MSIHTNAVRVRLDGSSSTDGPHRPPAQFATRWLNPYLPVIIVYGEIDASNADEFVSYAQRHTGHARRLVLDLSPVGFIGTEGFSALQVIKWGCVRTRTDWALVPSNAVTRLVQICDPDDDPDCALPIAGSVDAAVTALQDPRRRPLQLVLPAR